MPITLIIELVKRYLPYIIGVAVTLLALVYLYYKIYSGGYTLAANECAARIQEIDRQSYEYLKLKNHEVDLSNRQNNERKINAITIYAQHAANLQSDVDNLARRMRHEATKTNCNTNTLPGTDNDHSSRKSQNNGINREIAATVIELANSCEMQINKLEVKD